MDLDRAVCSRARLSRDPRFDGKFFIAVLSTRIYCRPICPARNSKEENVRYFPTAAAAAEAGFRPCLRCRPESSPGTPAWLGTSNTVSRALRLIRESGLEGGGVEALADHLGVGSRHLRRLFLKHLGATPSAVAQTRRLDFAKKLIDETGLPMTQVALASGFGCVRRFNATIKRVYQRTPTQIRHITRHSAMPAENQYHFRLPFRPPLDWNSAMSFLAARATPGVETVEDGIYSRTISVNGTHGYFEASLDPANYALAVHVQFADPSALFFIIERIRRLFDLNADWATIVGSLRDDPALLAQVAAHPGMRVPGCWNGFELATRAILDQHRTVNGATALAGKLVSAFGQPFTVGAKITHLFPSSGVLAEARLADAGISETQAKAIRALARAVSEGKICFEGVTNTEVLLSRLREIPGIGNWTAQYIAMRALGEPDAFPSGDSGILRALNLRNSDEAERRAEAWRPWRAYAAIYLWNGAAELNLQAKYARAALGQ